MSRSAFPGTATPDMVTAPVAERTATADGSRDMVGRQDGGATDGETTGVVEIPAGGPAGRLTVTGQLDPPARDRLLEEVARLTAAGTAVELDLRQLVWIDSSGLGTMIRANRLVTDAGAPRMRVLVAETGMVRRLLQLTMLHLALDVVTV